MMCCCEKCHFVFEAVRMLKHCPDCGYGPVRVASESEARDYAANRRQYGPIPWLYRQMRMFEKRGKNLRE